MHNEHMFHYFIVQYLSIHFDVCMQRCNPIQSNLRFGTWATKQKKKNFMHHNLANAQHVFVIVSIA